MSKREPTHLTIEDLPPCKGGVSRRGFCVATGAGLLTIGLSACDPGAGRVGVGALGGIGPDDPGGVGSGGGHDGGAGGNPDLSQGGGGNPDLSQGGGNPDLSQGGGTCSGPVNAGAASAITTGQAKHFTDNFNYDLFVVRDANGLYAINGSCPHAGCTVTKQSTQWYCNCHGATWDLDGNHPTSPAHSALQHYSVCVDASGTVFVDYNKTVPYTTRV